MATETEAKVLWMLENLIENESSPISGAYMSAPYNDRNEAIAGEWMERTEKEIELDNKLVDIHNARVQAAIQRAESNNLDYDSEGPSF
jgi:hypothetical protein